MFVNTGPGLRTVSFELGKFCRYRLTSGPIFMKGLIQGLSLNRILLCQAIKPKSWLSHFVKMGPDVANRHAREGVK